jgi:hypothetical protein
MLRFKLAKTTIPGVSIQLPPKQIAGSPVTNRRREPVSAVAAAPCQCGVALPPRFCIGSLTFGDHPLCVGVVFPRPAHAIAHRLPANPEAGRRSPVRQLFSDGRQKQRRSENNQARPVRCHSAWSRIRAISVLIDCASRIVGRQRSGHVTNYAGRRTACRVEKSTGTHSNRCSVIY